MKKPSRQQASNALTSGVSALALASSYIHGKDFCADNGAGAWAWGFAAIPEALLMSALLQDKRDWRFAAKVGISVVWTFGVNIAGAVAHGGGAATLVVALLAPVAAVLCAATNHGKPEKPVKKASKRPGVVASGVKWAEGRKTVPSVDEIMKARKCSRRSAEAIQRQAFPMAAVQHKLG